MSVNYELADLFFKLNRQRLRHPARDDEKLTLDDFPGVRADAKSFILTYEQVCDAIQPGITPDDLVRAFVAKLG